VREVRVIDDEGNQLGIMTPFDAIKKAKRRTWTWSKYRPQRTPVCRIMISASTFTRRKNVSAKLKRSESDRS